MSEENVLKEVAHLCMVLLDNDEAYESNGGLMVKKTWVTELYADGEKNWHIKLVGNRLNIYEDISRGIDFEFLFSIDHQGDIRRGFKYDFVECCQLLNALRKHLPLDAMIYRLCE